MFLFLLRNEIVKNITQIENCWQRKTANTLIVGGRIFAHTHFFLSLPKFSRIDGSSQTKVS